MPLFKWIEQLGQPKPLFNARLEQSDYAPSQPIGLTLYIQSSQIESYIDKIQACISCQFKELEQTNEPSKLLITQVMLAKNLLLQPKQSCQNFYLVELPLNCPISNAANEIKIDIMCFTASGEVNTQSYPLNIGHTQLGLHFLNALKQLGFSESLSWVSHNKLHKQASFNHTQKFKYNNVSNPDLPDDLSITFCFETFSDYLDVHLQIQTAQLNTEKVKYNSRFSLTEPNPDYIKQSLLQLLKKASTQNHFKMA